MGKTIYFDTETFSETPITDGTYRYAENAEIIMWQACVDDGDVMVADADDVDQIDYMLALLNDPANTVVIHNSMFDRNVCRLAENVVIPTSRIFDTMVAAYAHSLPGSLGELCEVLNIAQDKTKDKEGKRWIQLFCKPLPKNQKLRRATRETHPVEWAKFREYGKLDVIAMRECYRKLPRWNYNLERGAGLAEHQLWQLDQVVNDRGMHVDIELALAAIDACEIAKAEYRDQTYEITNGEVNSASQVDKMLKFALEEHGVWLPDMKASTLERRVDDPDLPPELRELLMIRLESSKTSVSKYKRLKNGVSIDGRLRGCLQFNGASRTCRWAHRLFQPGNMPRPTMKARDIEDGIEILRAGAWGLV